jgi:hypothetical protein
MTWIKSRIPEIINAYLARKIYINNGIYKINRSKEDEIMMRLCHSVLTISELRSVEIVTYRNKQDREIIKKFIDNEITQADQGEC